MRNINELFEISSIELFNINTNNSSHTLLFSVDVISTELLLINICSHA